MKKNIGLGDKIARGILGLFLVYIASANYSSGAMISVIAFIFGLYFILTSMFERCPLYSIFGISTKHEV